MPFYSVRVAPGWTWDRAQVAGREFTKAAPVRVNESEMNDEIRKSPLLVVEFVPDPEHTPEPPTPEASNALTDPEPTAETPPMASPSEEPPPKPQRVRKPKPPNYPAPKST